MKTPSHSTAALLAGAAVVISGAAAAVSLRSQQRRTHVERTLRVWRLTARRSVQWAELQVRGRAASEAKRAALEEKFVIRSAEDVASVLGNMKGAIMKAGQQFSFIADGLPPEAAAALATLQADVEPMSPSLAESVIVSELGAKPSDLFLEWNPIPVAAASVGQVHKAVLRDGRVVAVKVQYPGVDTAIGSDLDNAQLLYSMFSQFALPNLDVKALVDEVRERMSEELDYRLEAASQQEFCDYYLDHPFIRIPAVVPQFSSQRVLTSEWVEGKRWQDFLDTATDEAKQTAAEVLMRFAQCSLWTRRAFNGDPHPGNYKFHDDGTITFLDFGLVKRWSDADIAELNPVHDAVFSQNADALLAQMHKMNSLPSGNTVEPERILEYASTPYAPFLVEEFQYTREFVQTALRKTIDIDGNYRDLLASVDLPTSYVILDRLVWGLGALFGRLHAKNQWRGIVDEYRSGGPIVTELGRKEAQWRASRTSSAPVN